MTLIRIDDFAVIKRVHGTNSVYAKTRKFDTNNINNIKNLQGTILSHYVKILAILKIVLLLNPMTSTQGDNSELIF